MEPEGSSQHFRHSEPDQSSPCLRYSSWRSILILSLHLHLGLPNGLFASGFLSKPLYAPLLSPICITSPRPSYSSWLDQPNNKSQSSLLCSLLHSLVASSLLRPQHPFLNILSLLYSLNVKNQGSHPYKTALGYIDIYFNTFLQLTKHRCLEWL